jgi:hypothetical protein
MLCSWVRLTGWIDAFRPNDVAYADKHVILVNLKIATTSHFTNSFYEFIGAGVFFCDNEKYDD